MTSLELRTLGALAVMWTAGACARPAEVLSTCVTGRIAVPVELDEPQLKMIRHPLADAIWLYAPHAERLVWFGADRTVEVSLDGCRLQQLLPTAREDAAWAVCLSPESIESVWLVTPAGGRPAMTPSAQSVELGDPSGDGRVITLSRDGEQWLCAHDASTISSPDVACLPVSMPGASAEDVVFPVGTRRREGTRAAARRSVVRDDTAWVQWQTRSGGVLGLLRVTLAPNSSDWQIAQVALRLDTLEMVAANTSAAFVRVADGLVRVLPHAGASPTIDRFPMSGHVDFMDVDRSGLWSIVDSEVFRLSNDGRGPARAALVAPCDGPTGHAWLSAPDTLVVACRRSLHRARAGADRVELDELWTGDTSAWRATAATTGPPCLFFDGTSQACTVPLGVGLDVAAFAGADRIEPTPASRPSLRIGTAGAAWAVYDLIRDDASWAIESPSHIYRIGLLASGTAVALTPERDRAFVIRPASPDDNARTRIEVVGGLARLTTDVERVGWSARVTAGHGGAEAGGDEVCPTDIVSETLVIDLARCAAGAAIEDVDIVATIESPVGTRETHTTRLRLPRVLLAGANQGAIAGALAAALSFIMLGVWLLRRGTLVMDTQGLDAPFLERYFKEGGVFHEPAGWRATLTLREAAVCRVEIDGHAEGTGFLVAPDLVITNWHVVEDQIKGGKPWSGVSLRFDELGQMPELVARLGPNALAASSPVHDLDGRLGKAAFAAPTDSELDYAVLQLSAAVRDRPPIPVPAAAGRPEEKSPLLILQHPLGVPLRLAMNTSSVIAVNARGTRMRHRTSTSPGSSGSPCFDADLRLVALHQGANPRLVARYNQGIPISAIERALPGTVRERLVRD